MYTIKTLNKISPIGLEVLSSEKYNVVDNADNPDAILVRSAKMHGMEMPEKLLAIGRAGAGVNNIPIDECAEKGIVVFNTPGGNANAVKELVIAGLLLASRDIVGGINWAKTLKGTADVAKVVEAEKNNFGGNEIYGKRLGVIGLGAIGVLVANAATDMGMEVLGADPYISIESAWNLHPSVKKVDSYKEFTDCDFITVHIPLLDETNGIINSNYLSTLKNGVCILNFSRGELVDNASIIEALESGQICKYITDFPQEDTVGVEGIIAIPHLGASTEESEDNCAKMAAREIKHYLEYGNIVNSVNLPSCALPYTGKPRIAIIHQNVPTTISRILDSISKLGLNIENMINKSKSNVAYTIIDLDNTPNNDIITAISDIKEVIRIRVI